MTLLNRVCVSHYYYFIETMSVWHDLEAGGRGCSSSLKMALFNRSYMTFYWSTIVTMALFCTVFELFDVE